MLSWRCVLCCRGYVFSFVFSAVLYEMVLPSIVSIFHCNKADERGKTEQERREMKRKRRREYETRERKDETREKKVKDGTREKKGYERAC